ncbi:MAG: 30S ribosome-binding factor RbfA [Wigglesworthia glossinidia]|nr:30S ribosome-binding factor RbfA [Wigglesworthia glossinidia]
MLKKKNSRRCRISKEIQRKIATIIHQKINDPRLGMSTVSGIKLSRDFSHAKIFVTFLNKNTQKQIDLSICILNNSTKFIRKILNKNTKLRNIPKLTFVYDNSLIQGARIDNLIKLIH